MKINLKFYKKISKISRIKIITTKVLLKVKKLK